LIPSSAPNSPLSDRCPSSAPPASPTPVVMPSSALLHEGRSITSPRSGRRTDPLNGYDISAGALSSPQVEITNTQRRKVSKRMADIFGAARSTIKRTPLRGMREPCHLLPAEDGPPVRASLPPSRSTRR
jgi:hypothetical protein